MSNDEIGSKETSEEGAAGAAGVSSAAAGSDGAAGAALAAVGASPPGKPSKISHLVNIRVTLMRLLNAPLPASLSLRLARFTRVVKEDFEEFDNQHNRLLKQYGKSVDGINFEFPDLASRISYNAEMAAVGEEAVSLPEVTIKMSELGDREILSALDVVALLDWLLVEG